MIGIATHCQQTAMHLWMQGLYSPVHHFRKARQVGNVLHVQTSLAQGLGRSSGRYQFDPMTAKSPTQLYQPVFVGHSKPSQVELHLTHSFPFFPPTLRTKQHLP